MIDIVYARFVEAAAASGRPWSRAGGPRAYGASWFDPSRLQATMTRFDINAIHEGEKLGTREVSDAPSPSPEAIKRADEVITEWVLRYLAGLPDESVCLWAHAGSRVGWGSFRRFCRRNGLAERTGRRLKDKALQAVVVGLENDGRVLTHFPDDAAPHLCAEQQEIEVRSGPAFTRHFTPDETFIPRTPEQIKAFEKQLARVNKRRRKLRKWAERARASA